MATKLPKHVSKLHHSKIKFLTLAAQGGSNFRLHVGQMVNGEWLFHPATLFEFINIFDDPNFLTTQICRRLTS